MNRRGCSKNLVYAPLFAVLLAVCSWITVPSAVPFTLQTFGVCLALLLLGGKGGTVAILVYIFVGMIGLPVFHGFTGGVGMIISPTGGYILGFVLMSVVYGLITYFGKGTLVSKIIGIALGMTACYTIGTLWFVVFYANETGAAGISAALGICVLPFLIPDILKILLAFGLAKKIRRHTRNLYL